MAIKCSKCQIENHETVRFCLECGTPICQAKNPPVTKTVRIHDHRLVPRTALAGRYEIIEKIGAGGME
jgi:hypothetical protein